jgi:hypothetical protein
MGGLVVMELATAQRERCWPLGLVTTTVEPVSTEERARRRERADLVERDGMQVLIDYMHTDLYGPRCPPAVRVFNRALRGFLTRAPAERRSTAG